MFILISLFGEVCEMCVMLRGKTGLFEGQRSFGWQMLLGQLSCVGSQFAGKVSPSSLAANLFSPQSFSLGLSLHFFMLTRGFCLPCMVFVFCRLRMFRSLKHGIAAHTINLLQLLLTFCELCLNLLVLWALLPCKCVLEWTPCEVVKMYCFCGRIPWRLRKQINVYWCLS